MFADLSVTQSLLPGVSQAQLRASPGRERTWGRGRRGRSRSSPAGPGARGGVSLAPRPQATRQELAGEERDGQSPPPAGSRPLSVGRERRHLKWSRAGAAAAAGRRAPGRRGRGSPRCALRPGAHARSERGRRPARRAAPFPALARLSGGAGRRILARTRRGSSPSWIFIFWENFFELSYRAAGRRRAPTAGSLAGGPAGARPPSPRRPRAPIASLRSLVEARGLPRLREAPVVWM